MQQQRSIFTIAELLAQAGASFGCTKILCTSAWNHGALSDLEEEQNIEVVSGQGSFEIPFVSNDPSGTWRIVVRDVISGKTAELTLVRE